MNVALASPKEIYGNPPGTWCFVLEGGIEPARATVVASAVYTEDLRSSAISAQWVPSALDCSPNQIEIRTFSESIKEGKVVTESGAPVHFSFAVFSASALDRTPPTFEGLQKAFGCSPLAPAAFELSWKAATDDVTPRSSIVYDVFYSHTRGGEDYSHPTWTTPPGATTFKTPPLSEPAYFVVRARDQAGNEDHNTVEREGENPCE